MSRSSNMDERIVQMRFDNKDFDKNVKNTMNTLANLNDSLDVSASAKKYNKSMNDMESNTGLLSTTMDKVGKSWSAWEIVAITAISNITNRVIDLGIQITKSLSTDQVSAGFDKYNEKLGNTSTLLSQGFDLETINKQLDKLLAYTDATSYNFVDMTNNIAKFTATGQGLEDSVNTMMGIANWAALSGQDAQKASQAMYQLSQAMSSGYIRYQDWRSIQYANMDTQEFRKKAVEIAEITGTLYKVSDDLYRTLEGTEYSLNQLFKEGLSDNWFTSDVLMKTTDKFAFAYNEMLKMMENTGNVIPSTYEAFDIYKNLITSIAEGSDLTPVIKQFEDAGVSVELYTAEIERLKAEMTDETYKSNALFGVTSQNAAQEFRKFEDISKALKDAVSTTWMTVFENIVGNAEKAKEVWSNIYGYLEKIFLAIPTMMKNVTKAWQDLGGRDDLFSTTEGNLGAVYQLLSTLSDVVQMIKESFFEVFFDMDITSENSTNQLAERLKSLTANLKKFADNLNKFILSHRDQIKDIIKTVLNGIKIIVNLLKIAINIIKSVVAGLKPLTQLLGGGSNGLLKITEKINSRLEDFLSKSKIFNKITNVVTKTTQKLVDVISEMKILDKIKTGWSRFKEALANNGKTVDTLKKIWQNLQVIFSKLFKTIVNYIPKVSKLLGKGFAFTLKWFGKGLEKLLELSSKWSKKFNEWRSRPKTIERWNKITEALSNTFHKLGDVIHKAGSRIWKQLKKIKFKNLSSVFSVLWKILKKIGNAIKNVASIIWNSGIVKLFDKIKKSVTDTTKAFDDSANKLNTKTQSKWGKFVDKLKSKFAPVFDMFTTLKDFLNAFAKLMTSILNTLIVIFNKISKLIDKVPKLWENKTFLKWKEKFKNVSNIKKIALVAGLILLVKVLYDVWTLLNTMAAVTDLIYSLSGFLRAKSFAIISMAISHIINSLVLMVASIALLSKIKPEKLNNGIKYFGEILGGLIVFVGILMGLVKLFSSKRILDYASEFSLFGKKINGYTVGQRTAMTELASSLYLLSKSLSRVAIAMALMILPIKILGNMKEKTFKDGFDRLTKLFNIIMLYMGTLIMLSKNKKVKDGESIEQALNPNTIKQISKSLTSTIISMVGIAFAINRLGKLDSKKFKKGFNKLLKIFAILAGYQLVMIISAKKLIKSYDQNTNVRVDKMITSIGFNMLLLSSSLFLVYHGISKLSKVSTRTFRRGAIALSGILAGLILISAIMTAFAKAKEIKAANTTITKEEKSVLSSLGDIGRFLLSLGVIAASIGVSAYLLSKLNKTQIKRASIIMGSFLAAIIIMTTVMDIITKVMTKNIDVTSANKATKGSKILTSTVYSLVALGAMFGVIALLNWKQIKKSSAVISLLAGSILAIIVVSGIVSKFTATGTSNVATLLAFTINMGILAAAFVILGSLNWKKIGKGAAGIGILTGILLVSLALIRVISKINSAGTIGIVTSIASIGVLATSLIGLAAIFTKLGEMSWKQIGKAAAAMGILSGILLATAALAAVIGFVPGSQISIAAIAALAAGIGVALLGLAAALYVLDNVDIDNIVDKLDTLLNWFIENKDTISSGITAIIVALVSSIITAITEAAPKIIEAIGGILLALYTWLEVHIYELVTKILGYAKNAIQAIIDDFNKGSDSLASKILELAQKVIDFIKTDVAYFIGKNVVSVGPTIIKYIVKGAKDGLGSMYDIGKDIMNGMWNGIKSMANTIKNKFMDLVKKIIPNPIRKVLGINSPSKVMADIGKWTMLGLDEGITDNSDRIGDTMSDVANSIADSIDDDFTITPVLDLSEIQNGQKQMSNMLATDKYAVSASMATSTQRSVNNAQAAELRAANITTQQPVSGDNIVLNNTFNITGETDPNEVADAVSKKIAEQITRRKAAWQ